MTTKELINTEIEKLSEDDLKKVYGVVRSLTGSEEWLEIQLSRKPN